MGLLILLGKKGSGKTTLMTLFGLASLRDYTYANYRIISPKISSLPLSIILDINHADVLIDEAYTWLESRASGNIINRILSYVLMQSRKRHVDFYLSAQLNSMIDLRFRNESDLYILCNRVETVKDGENILLGFLYEFTDFASKSSMSFLSIKDAIPIFSMFDSYEIVNPRNIQALKYALMDMQNKFDESVEIAKVVYPLLKGKITHDNILRHMRRLGYFEKYEKDVYLECKDMQELGKETRLKNLKFNQEVKTIEESNELDWLQNLNKPYVALSKV